MGSTTRALRRIQKEITDLNANPVDGVSYEPAEDNLFNWKCSIKGASDSPYKGGTFHFKLAIPEDYPFKPPAAWYFSCGCTRLFTKVPGNIHYEDLPSRNQRGRQYMRAHSERSVETIDYSCYRLGNRICGHATILTDIYQVLSVIQEKVNNPSADDPFEPEIAAQLKNDKAAFLATARDWTKKHA
ncbi:ubiquitin-conjugating enzyme [Lactarius indigo]|nr:ubiquitin-conjugating enzyme [Lactarius indigo]